MQPSWKWLDFKFPPTLFEEVGYQIYIFPNSTFEKNTFGHINRFSLENLGDFLWNAPNLPIFYFECSTHGKSGTSDAGRADPHFPKCHIRAHCVCVCVRLRGSTKVWNSSTFWDIFFWQLLFICIQKGLVWGQKRRSENCTLTTKFEKITRTTSL